MQQLSSYYDDKAIEINVDYTNFSNFIHFSSATERINNFVYKLELIEGYQQEILDSQNLASMGSQTLVAVSQSNVLIQQKIDNIIKKFDVYEYYLYFSSESFAWPKSTSVKPYSLYSTTSSQAIAWLGDEYTYPSVSSVSMLYSASLYDDTNKDKLSNAVPQYLLDDSNNEPYIAFIDMVGQHFDNLWLYYKDLSNRYSSFNNPKLGISKDLVADALRGFGFSLYTNTSVSDNLYYTLFGMNPDGSLLPPTGSEVITNYVTSSIETLSPKELDSEIYKRLYHNLSYLLKTKGSQRAVKALIASYGIPDSILTINEFGGNNIYTGSGIFEINNQKINYFTQSAELSDPVLSPYVTLQRYSTDYRTNVLDVEAGFSPSNEINRNFVSSSGFVNMDQLIGNPNDQYLDYYPSLKTVSDNYFASYNYPHSIWEYIRIIKYYNNSLFKTIKDFVPARANASTGIVIKSHILERNKYARHEPSMSLDNNMSESIDMISIVGGDSGAVRGDTDYLKTIMTPLGQTSYDYEQNLAKYTGEFSGSYVEVTSGEAFDQSDYSTTPSGSIEVDYPATYQNVITANRSKRFFELDYSYNQNVPTNLGLITQSISNSIENNFNTYNDPYAPYADIQDYNYYTRAFTDNRFYGTRTVSKFYNIYTSASSNYEGDSSYGKTAAIDKIKLKYAYLVDIYSSSLYLPGRSNAQIKYLIENDTSVLNLTKANFNITEVQNIFKSGETCDVSLFSYDEDNDYTQLLANNPTLEIYEGGYRYLPILHDLNASISPGFQTFTLNSPIAVSVPIGTTTPISASNFKVDIEVVVIGGSNPYTYAIYASASYLGSPALSFDTQISFTWGIEFTDILETPRYFSGLSNSVTIPASSLTGPSTLITTFGPYNSDSPNPSDVLFDTTVITTVTGQVSSTGSVSTTYTTQVTGSDACIFYNTSSRQLVFNSTIAQYYNTVGLTFKSTSDNAWASTSLPRVILPFTIEKGDRISFYDVSSSLGWNERFEYVVNDVSITGSGDASRLLVTTVPTIDGSSLLESTPDSTTGANFKACRYVVWKHVPDETNVILRYNPIDQALVEKGLLFPQYIDSAVKQNAGNTIQTLTANNLISE